MKTIKSPWIKCTACLLLIAVISGALLAMLNDLLFVSAYERTARAIRKIYGEEKEYTTELDVDYLRRRRANKQDLQNIQRRYSVPDNGLSGLQKRNDNPLDTGFRLLCRTLRQSAGRRLRVRRVFYRKDSFAKRRKADAYE